MRRIGRYALLDLREHTGENDKIRPNKNYHADPGETNAYIVYSDVVVSRPRACSTRCSIAPRPRIPAIWP